MVEHFSHYVISLLLHVAFSKINSLDFIVCPFFCDSGTNKLTWELPNLLKLFYFPFQLFDFFFFIRTGGIKEK